MGLGLVWVWVWVWVRVRRHIALRWWCRGVGALCGVLRMGAMARLMVGSGGWKRRARVVVML